MSDRPVLIIDDEPGNLATLRQILANDYKLVFARNGAEGLAAARKHQPALILLDIQMPDMDGLSVCRQLKADPLTESTPVIFVSSLSEVGDEAAGFEIGAVDYIIKPVSPALVRARVRTHLSLVRATALERYVRQLELERAKTARLSRIHAVLSSANSAIVRIREAQGLVAEACRIAVEQGGFGIAWIGLLDEAGGAAGSLQLAVSEGVAMDDLAQALCLQPDKTAAGLGIPEQVLQHGEARYCNNVVKAMHIGRTCRDAYDRGYLSLVGLPLTVMEKTVGVMVLYAREADYFDEHELKLLCELAGDISFALQASKHAERANFLSCYDALTELPNTTLFLDRLAQLIQAARRENQAVFVIALNLDHFKQINDSRGRHVGDKVLRLVARRLHDGLSHLCSVAHIGADNFALVGEQTSGEGVRPLCDQVIALLSEPLQVDGQPLQLSVRLGVAIYPLDANNAESLFKNAEAALKLTKSVKSPCLYYSSEINARMAGKIELEHMLRVALERGEFVLYYQPKVDLATGRIAGAEALIRWCHPVRGMVPPIEFITLAEETGLILEIGTWVIQTACAQNREWQARGLPPLQVAVNVSAHQFLAGNLPQVVKRALAATGLPAQYLEIELTESVMIQDTNTIQSQLAELTAMGLSLSLDDFGTGYSSLSYLSRFMIDTLKIDQSFVRNITTEPRSAVIAQATIALAHGLGISVIAEGVETDDQLNHLRGIGCDAVQGYLFSRPLPAEELANFLLRGPTLAA